MCHAGLPRRLLGRVQASQKTWSGVPLFLCVGKVDDNKGHGNYGDFNEALALKGYRIETTYATGTSAIIGSRTVRNVETIILASKQMGSRARTGLLPAVADGPEDHRQEIGRADHPARTLLPK